MSCFQKGKASVSYCLEYFESMNLLSPTEITVIWSNLKVSNFRFWRWHLTAGLWGWRMMLGLTFVAFTTVPNPHPTSSLTAYHHHQIQLAVWNKTSWRCNYPPIWTCCLFLQGFHLFQTGSAGRKSNVEHFDDHHSLVNSIDHQLCASVRKYDREAVPKIIQKNIDRVWGCTWGE